jgi:hydroxylamine reductase
MFCYQCEQARGNSGCETTGVCGKPAEVGELHDVLFHVARELSALVLRLPRAARAAYHAFIEDALFATVSNVNFDAELIEAMIHRGRALMDEISGQDGVGMGRAARDDLLGIAEVIAIPLRQRGWRRPGRLAGDATYGVKGLAAIRL